MKKNLYKRMLAYAIPLLIVGGMTYKPLTTSLYGENIVLKTTPLDPRDLFRGDHVLIDLDIERVPMNRISSGVQEVLRDERENGSFIGKEIDVFVRLIPKENQYVVNQVVLEKPSSGIYLKGTINPYEIYEEKQDVPIHYNLDRYFVPENTGMALERGAREGNALVSLKVKDGYGVIQEVTLDESPRLDR